MSVEKIADVGGITRLVHDEIGFTVAVTQVLRSIKSLDAKGLYITLLGYPQNWHFYREQLIEALGIGKDKLKRCVDELKELGLITEKEIRDENGQFQEVQMHINLGINLQKPSKSSEITPEAGLPHAGLAASGKQPAIKRNTYIKRNKDINLLAIFDKFWDAYPRKVKKAKALDAFFSNGGQKLITCILDDIAWRKVHDETWTDPQYIPHPTSYLNARRWEDERTVPNTVAPPKQSRGKVSPLMQMFLNDAEKLKASQQTGRVIDGTVKLGR